MAPKKRKLPTSRPRTQGVIERDVLTERCPAFVRSGSEEVVCGACLLPIESDAQVGVLDNCTHVFHHECADRWSQTENTCPQCKLRFFWLASYSSSGKRVSLVKVESKDQEEQEETQFEEITVCEKCKRVSLVKVESKDQEEQEETQFEEITVCEKCKEVGDEAQLLLCDGMNGTCNAPFHYTCVGLSCVPRGSWFCPDCVERGFDTDAQGRRGPGSAVSRSRTRAAQDAAELQEASAPSRPDGSPTVSRTPPPTEAVTPQPSQGSRGRRAATAAAVENERPAAVSVSSASSAGSSAGGPATGEKCSSGAPPRRRGLPSQLRLSALACVTPAVEVPSFQRSAATSCSTGDSGEQPAGIFASFAQRRRARQRAADSAASFITLNPTYEEDSFMAGKSGSGS
eukprot:TRINITY_DN26923_c0_g1_i1.p1 TRINITY_DN26923_c0_g1~~TRINITY_DN26923_c0_g1_i1.p1  ORF type:complete len:400 (+),score=72.74 TRINITY_DN26923_c0_g1_i1:53-1252(+)